MNQHTKKRYNKNTPLPSIMLVATPRFKLGSLDSTSVLSVELCGYNNYNITFYQFQFPNFIIDHCQIPEFFKFIVRARCFCFGSRQKVYIRCNNQKTSMFNRKTCSKQKWTKMFFFYYETETRETAQIVQWLLWCTFIGISYERR